MNREIKVLMLCDFACTTGFAQVAHNIVEQLFKEKELSYKIDIIAINYFGDPNKWQKYYPQIRLFPAMVNDKNKDPFGRQKYLDFYMTGDYDLTFILQDTFNLIDLCHVRQTGNINLSKDKKKVPKLILYFPIDSSPKKRWVNDVIATADQSIVYTKYGYEEVLKVNEKMTHLLISPHGTNIDHFNVINESETKQFRQEYYPNASQNKFLITNVNRNQHRKDLPSTLKGYKLYRDRYNTNSFLYLHCMNKDVGHDLHDIAQQLGLRKDIDYMIPEKMTDLKTINLIYNSSDCVVTTTHGEGWGLSITEAMATKTPVIAHNVTSVPEIFDGSKRGWPVNSNGTVFNILDNNRERPQIDIEHFAQVIDEVRLKADENDFNTRINNAYEYVKENTWDKLGKFWRDTFKSQL